MKRQTFTLFMILAFLAGFLFHNFLSPAPDIKDETAIATSSDSTEVMNIVFQDFPNAYQRGEESAHHIANLFFEDTDMVILSSPWLIGQQAVQERFSHLSNYPEGRTISFELESFFFIGNQAAWVNVNSCDQGGLDEEGNELADYCDRGSFLIQKRNGVWKIAALRAFESAK